MWVWSWATSSSFLISTITFFIRSKIGAVAKISCNSSLLAVVKLAAKSASGDGSWVLKRLRKNFNSSEYSGLSGINSFSVLMIASE